MQGSQSHEMHLAGVAFLKPVNAGKNLCPALPVAQGFQPPGKFFGTSDLHARIALLLQL